MSVERYSRCNISVSELRACTQKAKVRVKKLHSPGVGVGGGVLGLNFAGYVPLIIAYSVASYRPDVSHFWANM